MKREFEASSRSKENSPCAKGRLEHDRVSFEERRQLLQLARESFTKAVSGEASPRLDSQSGALAECRACFVTLTKRGALRGCVGQVLPKTSLALAVLANARAAALDDPRFSPVTEEEVGMVHIEISVLSEMEPVEYSAPEQLLRQLCPGQDGVFLQMGSRQATFLPQVWTKIPDKVEFLSRLCEKAGCQPDEWRKGHLKIFVYQVESFEEL